MGVKERKEREKSEMRKSILNAAHDLFISKGFDQISIRNIADAIEYSPATIYLYFKDKNELFLELHNEAFRHFNVHLQPLFTIADPFERLIRMGELYLEFAMNHREYYELMFIVKAPMECEVNIDIWGEGAKSLKGLEDTVTACQEAGYLRKSDPTAMAFWIWSTMHGMVSLLLAERLKLYPFDWRDSIIKNSFESFIQTIRLK